MKERLIELLSPYKIEWQKEIDINSIWGYLNDISDDEWIWPYYFDSISISKDYYILTPCWEDLDYLRIPNKPFYLYTENELEYLYNLLIKLWKQ